MLGVAAIPAVHTSSIERAPTPRKNLVRIDIATPMLATKNAQYDSRWEAFPHTSGRPTSPTAPRAKRSCRRRARAAIVHPVLNEEDEMASYDDDSKRKHGRQFDQLTRDGTGSAASVGPGGTGDLDKSLQQSGQGGSQQSGGRMDDLLADNADESAKDFQGAGELQTGVGGTGSLSQGKQSSRGGPGGSMQSERDQAAEKEVPPSDARISQKSDRGT
jgi:hypothetical protein